MNGYVKLFVFQHAQSLFFQILRCGNNVFLCKNGTDDGDAADAAAGKLRHVIACDAADGDDRDFNGIADSSQRFVADILRIRLGTGVEDCATRGNLPRAARREWPVPRSVPKRR